MDDAEGTLSRAIAAAEADDRPPTVALMHLLIAAGGDPRLAEALDDAASRAAGPGSRRLAALGSLLKRKPDAAGIVADVMREADHAAGPDGDAIARWTRIFDSLALRHPAASVALYSLGDEDVLERATEEVVSWFKRLRLLGPERAVLDLGCGIGRITRALAPLSATVVGADVSHGMLTQALARSGAGMSFVRTTGRDLAAFADGSFDLVVACDVFPYLVAAGSSVAEDHARNMSRMLRPGGHVAILNLSYRGDEERDRADATDWAKAAGFLTLMEAQRPFTLWDGAAWLWRKPG